MPSSRNENEKVRAFFRYRRKNSRSKLEIIGDFLMSPLRFTLNGDAYVYLANEDTPKKEFRYILKSLPSYPRLHTIARSFTFLLTILLAPIIFVGIFSKIFSLFWRNVRSNSDTWEDPEVCFEDSPLKKEKIAKENKEESEDNETFTQIFDPKYSSEIFNSRFWERLEKRNLIPQWISHLLESPQYYFRSSANEGQYTDRFISKAVTAIPTNETLRLCYTSNLNHPLPLIYTIGKLKERGAKMIHIDILGSHSDDTTKTAWTNFSDSQNVTIEWVTKDEILERENNSYDMIELLLPDPNDPSDKKFTLKNIEPLKRKLKENGVIPLSGYYGCWLWKKPGKNKETHLENISIPNKNYKTEIRKTMLYHFSNHQLATKNLQDLLNSTSSIPGSFSKKKIAQIKDAILHGADLSLRFGYPGNTPLLLAILYQQQYPQLDLAEFIVSNDKRKASINLTDTMPIATNPPLILALKSGMYDLALQLLLAGADPNQPSGQQNFTPLHWACALLGTTYQAGQPCPQEKKLVEVIYLLLEKGAEIDAKNEFGHTPLDLLSYRVEEKDFILWREKKQPDIAEYFGFDADLIEKYKTDKDKEDSDEEALETQYPALHAFYKKLEEYIAGPHQCGNLEDIPDEFKEMYDIYNHPDTNWEYSPKYYSVDELIKDQGQFVHLTTYEEIIKDPNLTCYRHYYEGIENDPNTKPQYTDTSHDTDSNDWTAICSGATWHRAEGHFHIYTQNRNDFFKTPEGQAVFQKINQEIESKQKTFSIK